MSSPPTTLPSIQFLLKQQTSEDKRFTKGHRSTRSVSSLPSELQNLSLNGPSPSHQGTSPAPKDDSHIVNPQPSWMAGPPPPPPPHSFMSLSNSSTTSQQHHRPPMAHHQRSVSDLSMTTPPPPITSSTDPKSFHSFNSTNHQLRPTTTPPPPTTTTTTTTTTYSNPLGAIPSMQQSSSSLSPHHHHQLYQHHRQQQRQRHLSHRRAVSATTVDHMMQPSSSPNINTAAPPMPPLPFYHRAHSNSPPEDHLSLHATKPEPVDTFLDRSSSPHLLNKKDNMTPLQTPTPTPSLTLTSTSASLQKSATQQKPSGSITTHTTVNGMDLPRDAASGRYLCPFCSKAFSRPSSLRIHTYSHTKEKPFACPECPRQFSVQSNMRRHLRIHLIRPTNKTAF